MRIIRNNSMTYLQMTRKSIDTVVAADLLRIARNTMRKQKEAPMLTQNAKTFYDFVDQPLASLSPQNVLLITCVRIWARGAMARTCTLRLVAPSFVLSGHAAILVPFHAFMIVLGNSAARPIGLATREDGRVTDNEALLLLAFDAAKSASLERVKLAFASLVFALRLDAVTHKAVLLMKH